MDELETLLTPNEVAKKLHISKSTVYSFINRGLLPAIKIGKSVRLSPTDVQSELDKMKRRCIGVAA